MLQIASLVSHITSHLTARFASRSRKGSVNAAVHGALLSLGKRPRVRTLLTGALPLCAALCLNACSTAGSPVTADDGAHTKEWVLSPTASVFPLDRYDQNVDRWVDPRSADYHRPLLDPARQHRALQAMLNSYFGQPSRYQDGRHNDGKSGEPAPPSLPALSPWDPQFIADALNPVHRLALAARVEARLHRYSADGPQTGFGPNLRPVPRAWSEAIRRNIDIRALRDDTDAGNVGNVGNDGNVRDGVNTRDRADQRAIVVHRTAIRLLPTDDPFFYDPRLAGEGYPFDNLQESVILPGTPVYIVGRTRDRAWSYVLAPGVSGWAHTDAVGMVDKTFVDTWRDAAYRQLDAVIADAATLVDSDGTFRFDAPVGTVLPAGPVPGTVLTPAVDAERRAHIVSLPVSTAQWPAMPLSPTPANFAILIKALQGRPYGWGGTGFYNDCSLEIHNLMLPFGLVLPRHSSFQVAGPDRIDLSSQPVADRLAYLMQHGRPFLTIVHIPGHVMLYLGNSIVDGQAVPMVYEDMWGLSPGDRSRRAIVGQSAIMPLLTHFPEDPALESQAGGKIFALGFNALGLDTASSPAAATLSPAGTNTLRPSGMAGNASTGSNGSNGTNGTNGEEITPALPAEAN